MCIVSPFAMFHVHPAVTRKMITVPTWEFYCGNPGGGAGRDGRKKPASHQCFQHALTVKRVLAWLGRSSFCSTELCHLLLRILEVFAACRSALLQA